MVFDTILAILNGSARDFLYKKRVGKLLANQISSVILILVIFLVTYIYLRFFGFSASNQELLLLGLMWAAFTVAFEFLFFHYVGKHSWKDLLSNYNVLKGNFWPFVLIATAIAPWLINNLLK